MDCGPTCLRMIARHYGKHWSLQDLRDRSGINREGVSFLGISEAAEKIGFRTLGVKLSFAQLTSDVPLPCIVHWQQEHFVVVYKISKWRFRKEVTVHVADPAKGLLTYSEEEFYAGWVASNGEGLALALEPTAAFLAEETATSAPAGWGRVWPNVFRYRSLLIQLLLGLLVGSVLQLIFPFLTQAVVDIGVNTRNLSFVYLLLAAQLVLFAGRTAVEFIRSWILLHIGARLNLSLLSEFLGKLMQLPLSFFDTKLYGDLVQRVHDRERIEHFLTAATLQILFSVFNLFVLGIVLALYHLPLFVVFLLGTALYTGWVSLFLASRRKLDGQRFEVSARHQSKLFELIGGMQEIKLSGSGLQKRWAWEALQIKLFRLNVRTLALNQYQQAGAFFLNEGKNIILTIMAAKAVIDGELTLGAMLAVQYIIGQLNSPVEQFIGFLQTYQDAKISLDRLEEIHNLPDEEPPGQAELPVLPKSQSLSLRNVSFRYAGAGNEPVLKDISLHIPEGKVTAIVGTSGSGKTTLLKLLLRFYEPGSGEIRVGERRLDSVSQSWWRKQCGVVMQDGFIFSDTIARNITLGDEQSDLERLLHAVEVANILPFIESLPLSFNTRIGAEGNGLSQGQKQRILIARAVYKNPQFLFFDEATNALDAGNERAIMQQLDAFFKGRTVVVVAHRLSTVVNADQIVVLHRGEIVETGTHAELTRAKGHYYQLVKNQLELGQ